MFAWHRFVTRKLIVHKVVYLINVLNTKIYCTNDESKTFSLLIIRKLIGLISWYREARANVSRATENLFFQNIISVTVPGIKWPMDQYLWLETRKGMKEQTSLLASLYKHVLACVTPTPKTERFIKCYRIFLNSEVKQCDLRRLRGTSWPLHPSVILSLSICGLSSERGCQFTSLGTVATNWMRRARSSALAWGWEYFSIYLGRFGENRGERGGEEKSMTCRQRGGTHYRLSNE